MLLEVNLSKNGFIFSHIHPLFHFLEGKGIIYHLTAYNPKIKENVNFFYFGCHGSNKNITSYKIVSIETLILAQISLITPYFLCWSYIAPFQGIWNY